MFLTAEERNGMYLGSIVHKGDTRRIENTLKRVEQEKKLTIGFMGGSITEGALASAKESNYVSLTTKWWRKHFPAADIKCVNAGIGATDSILGVHRMHNDLLRFEPDFVVLEYSVNDVDSQTTLRCYEGIIRQLLESAKHPAVMLVFMCKQDGTSVQDLHRQVGLQYDLPMVSYRDAIWPSINAGRIKWEDIASDDVHPNDSGHRIVAELITMRLDEIRIGLEKGTTIADFTLGAPIFKNHYQNAAILNADAIEPLSYGSWAIYRQTMNFHDGWASYGGDSPLIFEVEAANIGIVYVKTNSYKMGRAEVRIDDQPPVILDGHFPAEWGGYSCGVMIAQDLVRAKHKLEIRLCEESHKDSKGKDFVLCGLMIS